MCNQRVELLGGAGIRCTGFADTVQAQIPSKTATPAAICSSSSSNHYIWHMQVLAGVDGNTMITVSSGSAAESHCWSYAS
jgi:hypothetical protein